MAKPKRTPEEVSEVMRKVHSYDTAPEIALQSVLREQGVEYEVHPSDLPGKPDIVLTSDRVAVFVDGEFWHGIQWHRRRRATLDEQFRESRNREYWVKKIHRNMQRDCSNTSKLLKQGWKVIRFWERDVLEHTEKCAEMTIQLRNTQVIDDGFSVLPEKTFAEFFAGIGLMRMGLEAQGWTLAFANDIDPLKLEMYQAQFQDANRHFNLGDIHKLSVSLVPTVTLATASFPCNDLSLAGARAGLGGKQSSAFWGFVRILTEMGQRRPPLVLIENVPGFLTSRGGSDFKEALKALNELGYAVDSFILDAVRFVPQSRQRLFVVGILDVQLKLNEPKKEYGFFESGVRPRALADFILANPDIRWSVRSLPSLPSNNGTSVKTILEDLPDAAPEWWSQERVDYLLNQMSPRHREKAEEMMAGDEWSYGTIFRRVRNGRSMAELRTDGIAGCLRTPRGGSGRQILLKVGRGKCHARLITPREAARLMGADEFNLTVPLNQALFGFGDAVCVPVISWIAEHYFNPVVTELMRGRPLQQTYGG
ncbi:MAG: DNA mismatch endonuclease Vsr [Chloroflexi bacterium]|nr:DNA mismatch endonuclease Vsr [Chloroflexota bacterium]